MFAPNWSAKGEYMYYDFGSTRFVTPVALAPFGNFHNDDHTLKLGVNYRFNFGEPRGRALLIDFNRELRKGRRSRRPFCLARFPVHGKSGQQRSQPKIAKKAPIFQTC